MIFESIKITNGLAKIGISSVYLVEPLAKL
jgi:hypothetical protein